MDMDKFAAAMAPVIRAEVQRATAPLLEKIAELEARKLPEAIKGDPGQNGADGKDGRDGANGESVSTEAVEAAVSLAVAKAVAEIPASQDGKDGRDGSDGATVALEDVERMCEAKVAGWALDFERRAHGILERAVDRLPKPTNGADGKDGRDGLDGIGFDDIAFEHDGERGLTLRFTRGDVAKEFTFIVPAVIDRGVFKDGAEYQQGDAVTWGGSLWLAQTETKEKPGSGNDWRLAVKKGRDGKGGN